ncbi:MAG: MBL fold metallo-hydrolase [Desulfobacterales bacterium]|nr:MBL fold metallo-hydrolase [Desulfobacterales bacterium]
MQVFDSLHAFIWRSLSSNNCNSYLIDKPPRVLIDPGHVNSFDPVAQGLREIGLENKDIGLIICTHGHPDHLEAVQLFKNAPTLFTIHEEERELVETINRYLESAYGKRAALVKPDFFLKEGTLTLKGLELTIIHTPGHSPGSISVYWPEKKALFTGDLIFKGGIGRTDLAGGNGSQLKESIKKLRELEIEWMLPGHGDMISGAEAVRENFDRIEQLWFNYL